jgi:hypothetical protein
VGVAGIAVYDGAKIRKFGIGSEYFAIDEKVAPYGPVLS